MQCGVAGGDDVVKLDLRSEVGEESFAGKTTTLLAGVEVWLEDFRKTGDVPLFNANQEAVPVDAGG